MYWSILKLIWHSSSLVRTSICWSITILSVSEQASFSTLQWSSTSERHVVVCCGSFGPLQVFHCSISIPINIWCISLYIYIYGIGWWVEKVRPFAVKYGPFKITRFLIWKPSFLERPTVLEVFGGCRYIYYIHTYVMALQSQSNIENYLKYNIRRMELARQWINSYPQQFPHKHRQS